MTHGFFSLIQYCPDASRAEAANVGLMIFQADPAATAVRIVDDVRPAMKRLGRKHDAMTLLTVAQSMRNRIEHAQFRSIESVETFVRTRGNLIQLTMPRPMQIESLERDLDHMFGELVFAEPVGTAATMRAPTLLEQTFASLARRLPDRVLIRPDLHVHGLGIVIRPDYAYRNGCLNVVQEMPRTKDVDHLRSSAFALSKEGELVRRLEEGEGRLLVVSSMTAQGSKAREREREFGEMLQKLGHAEFVPSTGVQAFANRVEAELSAH